MSIKFNRVNVSSGSSKNPDESDSKSMFYRSTHRHKPNLITMISIRTLHGLAYWSSNVTYGGKDNVFLVVKKSIGNLLIRKTGNL